MKNVVIINEKPYDINPIQMKDLEELAAKQKTRDIDQLKADFEAKYIEREEFYEKLQAIRKKSFLSADLGNYSDMTAILTTKIVEAKPTLAPHIDQIIGEMKLTDVTNAIKVLTESFFGKIDVIKEESDKDENKGDNKDEPIK